MRVMRSRLLKNYVLSYLSIALLACAIIGLSLFYIAAGQLNSAILQSRQKELSLAVNDLEHQYEIMQDIAFEVSTTIYYRSIYLEGGVSRKMNMQADFAKYQGYSPIVNSYFLYRAGDSLIWKPNAANSLDVFAHCVLNVQDAGSFYDTLNRSGFENIKSIQLDDRRLILLFPIHIDSQRNAGHDAVMGFLVYKSALLKRLVDVSAWQADTPFHLYFTGKPLFPETDMSAPAYDTLLFTETNVLDQSGGRLGSRSPDGLFSLAVDIAAVGISDSVARFRTVSSLVIIISLMLLVLLGYVIARHNYRPISKLAEKYGISSSNENEIVRIDTVLGRALEQNRLSEHRLSEQMHTLKLQRDMLTQQFLLLLLNGDYNATMETRARELGIVFAGNYYCAFAVSTQSLNDFTRDRIFRLIHELSDETLSCHCVNLKMDNIFAVIVSAGEMEQFAEVTDLIEALGNAENIDLSISQGKVCDDIRSLTASLTDALCEKGNTADAASVKEGVFDDKAAVQIVVALRCGDLDQAQEHLKVFVDDLRHRKLQYTTYPIEFANLLIALTRATEDLKAPQIRQRAGMILQSGSLPELYTGVSELLSEIHALIQACDNESENRLHAAVMDYIRSHATDYDLSLNRLASEFSLSIKYLRHIVKTETGKNLREWINQLRIERAKELLSDDGLSVSEIAQNVGYLSVSYFIKNFRTITGVTPANFRKADPTAAHHAPTVSP